MRYTDLNSSLEAHITTLRVIIAILVLIIIGLWVGWNGSKNDMRIHIPPDLRSGAILQADEVATANVYAFAFYIFQQLNHWPENGVEDYGSQIFSIAPYLTPEFREYLINDLDIRGKRGELNGRTREMHPVPGKGFEERRVDLLDADTWVVWIDYKIRESVRGMEIKNVMIRYPIKVVRYDVNPEVNPWGLALSGFGAEGPKRLTAEDLAAGEAQTATSTAE